VAVLFFGLPLIEIAVLIQVGQAIGPWWTIFLLVADSVFGAWLIKHEGRRALAALSDALSSGRMPARELADGVLIVVGGALMLSPGFVTDLFGMLCILPVTRPLARRALTHFFAARLRTGPPSGTFGPDVQRPRQDHAGDVIQGEVLDD
jgi:UPF0716 protein FxsA